MFHGHNWKLHWFASHSPLNYCNDAMSAAKTQKKVWSRQVRTTNFGLKNDLQWFADNYMTSHSHSNKTNKSSYLATNLLNPLEPHPFLRVCQQQTNSWHVWICLVEMMENRTPKHTRETIHESKPMPRAGLVSWLCWPYTNVSCVCECVCVSRLSCRLPVSNTDQRVNRKPLSALDPIMLFELSS